jgi:hypothetical protein
MNNEVSLQNGGFRRNWLACPVIFPLHFEEQLNVD